MRKTLLELVQDILSSMSSDEVNSITDTVESYQVAVLLRSVYYDLATDLGLLEHETLFGLQASEDATKPVVMTLPSNVTRTSWIKYDNKDTGETDPNYIDVCYLPLSKFVTMMQGLREGDSGTLISYSVKGDNEDAFSLLCRNDKFPQYYTTFNNNTILFDSYKSSIDTTLQQSKTMCFGSVYPEFELVDQFQPDLDPTQFSLFYNRAKVRAFSELKQVANQEAAGEARRQKIIVQKRNEQQIDKGPAISRTPRYGRK